MEKLEYRVKEWDREAMMEIMRPTTASEIIEKVNEIIDHINASAPTPPQDKI